MKKFFDKVNFNMEYLPFLAIFLVIAYFIVLSVFFTDPTTNSKSESSSSSLITRLEKNTGQIEIRKIYFHPNKKYSIHLGDEKVGYITSNNPIFRGKTFKIRDLDGNVIRSEKESKRFLTFNRSATFFDLSGYETIKIKENKGKNITEFNPEYRFGIFNNSGEIIGYTKANFFSILKKTHAIIDSMENNLYIIEKTGFFPKKYTIDIIEKDFNSIDVRDAILYTAINDNIISQNSNYSNHKIQII